LASRRVALPITALLVLLPTIAYGQSGDAGAGDSWEAPQPPAGVTEPRTAEATKTVAIFATPDGGTAALRTSVPVPDSTAPSPESEPVPTTVAKPVVPTLDSPEKDRWWNSDNAKVFIPASVSLIALLVTNLVTLWKIRSDSMASLRREFSLAEWKALKDRLEQFYDPLIALLRINKELFTAFGPNTMRDEQDIHTREERARVWKSVIDKSILPNNAKIRDLILSKSHLIDPPSSADEYMKLLTHIVSYEVFRNEPNAMHGQFMFPTSLPALAESQRSELIKKQSRITVEIGTYLSGNKT
jgi:hypothetical protein